MLSRQNRVRISDGRDDLKINRQRNPLSPDRLIGLGQRPFTAQIRDRSPAGWCRELDVRFTSFLWLGDQLKNAHIIAG